jgi:hypothetical protein
MKKLTITIGIFLSAFMVNAQKVDTLNQNTAEKLLNSEKNQIFTTLTRIKKPPNF